ncbi:hypothetical protein [Staphylococcus warneri]|nr:hypothetical protein [Staphylococcus warneri]
MQLMKLIERDAQKLTNDLKHAFESNNLTNDSIKVDFDACKVYVYELKNGVMSENTRNIDERYLKDARVLVRRHLPAEYRLKPQSELKFENIDDRKRLVIDFESAKSKKLDLKNMRKKAGYQIPLMTDVNWDISKEPHALITGVTVSGKSMMINYLFKSFKNLGAHIYTIDPKLADLYVISKKYLPNSNYAVETNDVIALLQYLNDILDYRQNILSSQFDEIGIDAYKSGMTPIVLFYDELAAFVMTLTDKK